MLPSARRLLSWQQCGGLTDAEIRTWDVAAVNLACADGLPGADRIDAGRCLRTLDRWARAVRSYTSRLMPQFRHNRGDYENSEAYFKALALVTVLQRDLGVRYNPAKVPADAAFDTADLFVHGVTDGDGGTCATLPVVYAAVGRRLGYPVVLASTRGPGGGHLFARWDDPRTGERFNIEASGRGLSTPPDDYYRTGLYDLGPDVEAQGCYLRSLSPRAEAAEFLSSRAWLWDGVGDRRRCAEAWAGACALAPENRLKANSLRAAMAAWDRQQRARLPPAFPAVWVRRAGGAAGALPPEVEADLLGLTAVENLLADARLEARHWGPLRRGERVRAPRRAVATFRPGGACDVDLHFD